MLIRILKRVSWFAFLVSFLFPLTPAWSERVWDEELNRYLTREELMQEDVYLTNEEAARLMFPDSEKIRYEVLTLTPDQKTLIEQRIKWQFPEEFFECFIGETDGKVDGWAIIQHTIGKHKPMTYMVGVDPDGEVMNVEVLVYRESRGSEVRKKRFNFQYEGKDVHDPIRINRDVINISGATMSVRSMSAGVKRALVLVDELYLKPLGRHSGLTASTQDEKSFFETFLGF
jgi:hypothetical protein